MDLLVRLTLAQAARLARSGEYGAAEALLAGAPVVASGPRADVLDLRARICAQQGRWSDAEALWREALALDPSTPHIQAALVALASPMRGRAHALALAARSVAGIAVLLLLWGVVAQRREIGRLTAAAMPSSSTITVRDPRDAFLDSLAAALEPLAGVEILRGDRELELRFPEGLFSEGESFRPGARDILLRLAQALAPMGKRVETRVVGHTDGVPLRAGAAYSSNRALGFARAARVAELLMVADALSERTAVLSAADGSPPYDATTAAGARRNRTATVHVAMAR